MKKSIFFPYLLLVGFIVLLGLSSCTYGTEGIFAGISREQKVTVGSLNKFLTVTSMAETSASEYFIATGASLFSRSTAAGSTWSVASNGFFNGKFVASVFGLPSSANLFVVAGDNNGNNRLYKSTDSGSSWSDVTPSFGNPVNIVPVIDSDGVSVYAGVVNVWNSVTGYYTYVSIDHSSALGVSATLNQPGGTASDGSTIVGVPGLILAVSHDTTNGQGYYFVNNRNLWNAGNDATFTTGAATLVSGLPNSSSENLTTLLESAGTLYLGSAGGSIWSQTTPPSGSWTNIVSNASFVPITITTTNNTPNSSGSTTPTTTQLIFTVFSWSSLSNTFLAGTRGNGLGEFLGTTFNKNPSASVDTNNYNSTVLPASTITVFFKGSNGSDFFMGTEGNGFWSWDSTTKDWSLQ